MYTESIIELSWLREIHCRVVKFPKYILPKTFTSSLSLYIIAALVHLDCCACYQHTWKKNVIHTKKRSMVLAYHELIRRGVVELVQETMDVKGKRRTSSC
jgi:hypothetical protein